MKIQTYPVLVRARDQHGNIVILRRLGTGAFLWGDIPPDAFAPTLLWALDHARGVYFVPDDLRPRRVFVDRAANVRLFAPYVCLEVLEEHTGPDVLNVADFGFAAGKRKEGAA